MKKETFQLTVVSFCVVLFVIVFWLFIWLHSLAQPNKNDSEGKVDCNGWYECIWFNHKTPELLRQIILEKTEYFGLDSNVVGNVPALNYVDPKSVGVNVWTALDEKIFDQLDKECDVTNDSNYVTSNAADYVLIFDSNGAYGSAAKARVCDVQNKRLVPKGAQPDIEWDYFDVLNDHQALTRAVARNDGELIGFVTLERSLSEGGENNCDYKLSNVSFNTGSLVTKVNKYRRPCNLVEEINISELPDLKDAQYDTERISSAAKFIVASRMGSADLELASKIASKGSAGKSTLADSILKNFGFNQKIENMQDVRLFHKKLGEWRKYVSELSPYLNLPSEYNLQKIDEVASALGAAISSAPSEYAMNDVEKLAEKTRNYRIIILNQEPEMNMYQGGRVAYYGLLSISPPKPVVIVSNDYLFNGRGMGSVTGYKVGDTTITHDGFVKEAIIIKSLSEEESEALKGYSSFKQNIYKLVEKCNQLGVWIRSVNNNFIEANPLIATPQ